MGSAHQRASLRTDPAASGRSQSRPVETLVGLFIVMLLALSPAAHADPATQTVVHLLDYVSVDYPEFVKDGKVLDAAEYKEQQEFAREVAVLLATLADVPQRAQLIRLASSLQARIDAKAPGDEIARLASALRWQVIEAYALAVAPKSVPDMTGAPALFASQCASCHGGEGRGDGPAAKGLDPAPSNFHDRDRMAQRSLYGLYSTITLGVAGTSMSGFGHLSEEQRWALAFHVGALGLDPDERAKGGALWQAGHGKADIGTLRAVATLGGNEVRQKHGAETAAVFAWLIANPQALTAGKESPIAFSRRLLAESATAYRGGKPDDAQRLALTAYLEGFELAEAGLDTLDRKLRQEIETRMIVYRDLMRRGAPVEDVALLAAHIDRLLAESADKLAHEGISPTTAAISAFFILLREGLEALLVVAAIIALLIKAGRRDALPWVHAGWIGALALGGVTWFVASALIEVSGATRELTEGVTALLAAAILLYMGVWLHDKSHARAWQAFIDARLRGALQRGTLWTLAGVSFLAVYREAFETVLFYQALLQQAGEGALGSIVVGFACAVIVLGLAAWAILRVGVRLPLGKFFALSAVLLSVLAIVFTGHGVKALQEAGAIAASPIGDGSGLPALGIYPSVETLAAQALMLALVCGGYLWSRNGRNKEPARA